MPERANIFLWVKVLSKLFSQLPVMVITLTYCAERQF